MVVVAVGAVVYSWVGEWVCSRCIEVGPKSEVPQQPTRCSHVSAPCPAPCLKASLMLVSLVPPPPPTPPHHPTTHHPTQTPGDSPPCCG